MPDAALPACSVLLLAGGRGQRMGGRDKGLLPWRGEPLIAHLHRQVRGLGDDLIVSCNRNQARYAPYADHLVSDDSDDFPGPLAGIRAGLAQARHRHMLVLPCDVPGIDHALLTAMLQAAYRHPDQPLMVRQGLHWEPLLCVIPVAHAAAFEHAWQAGERSPRQVMLTLGAQALQCSPEDPRLANLNTLHLLGE
ncbi:molybdenum cofactor guanylyltransferase MobA [Pseudomonas eucalypticola]|uniref:Molybdenum cofactor guanylyltransferase n=1 Tax=Pseudomonas eucalypticola TaxID=2599595 RepID=A0A7D5HCI1_9PSED|nr:molybdenum cofactor guanylyltransferase MobA [Pseudomonas eucalypticola]QKZ03970.1 molybdenum cofactor guanylyltransferase MobA [Pseudomonas eucalypticola]